MDELTTLCKSCGLCCDGSLFGRVDLTPEELPLARKNRLHVVNDRAFEQPCAALGVGNACAIYDERPHACRRFTCRLYARHAREGGPLEPRLAIVRRARELLGRLPSVSEELTRVMEEFATERS